MKFFFCDILKTIFVAILFSIFVLCNKTEQKPVINEHASHETKTRQLPTEAVRDTDLEISNQLTLSEREIRMAEVEAVPAKRIQLTSQLKSFGKIQINEETYTTITSRIDGYINKIFANFTGVEVKKGDHILEIYSPDLILAQNELLLSQDMESMPDLASSAKQRLLRLGITDLQIENLIKTKKIQEGVKIYSPVSGTVIEKMALEKAAVKPGDTLFKLSNLESVWAEIDIYESEYPFIRYGQSVSITAESFPGEKFKGRIWLIKPAVSEESRTIKVIVNISNKNRRLKPGMYVSANISVPVLSNGKAAPSGVEGKYTCPQHPEIIRDTRGQCPICGMTLVQIPKIDLDDRNASKYVLVIPASAVLDTGIRKIIYVEKSAGVYESREIILGAKAGDYYPILGGLEENEKVVVRGTFLLDSQFQIKGLPSVMNETGKKQDIKHSH